MRYRPETRGFTAIVLLLHVASHYRPDTRGFALSLTEDEVVLRELRVADLLVERVRVVEVRVRHEAGALDPPLNLSDNTRRER